MKTIIFFVLIISQSVFAAVQDQSRVLCKSLEKKIELVLMKPANDSHFVAALKQDGKALAANVETTMKSNPDQTVIAGEGVMLVATTDLSRGIVSYISQGKSAIIDRVTCSRD